MRKHLSTVLFAVCLLLATVPVAFAASTDNCSGDEACTHQAAIISDNATTHYDTLTEALSAATSGQTVKLLRDIDNSVDKSGYSAGINYSLKADTTLDGQNHTLSGHIGVYIPAAGATVTNAKFFDIHNPTVVDADTCKYYGWESKTGNQSAIYASGLTGTATITNCTFDNIDWDAIQITPTKTAGIVITNCVFQHTASDSTQLRYIHIQNTTTSLGIAIQQLTITDNQFYSTENPADDILCPIGIWKVNKNTASLNLSGNFVEDYTTTEVSAIGLKYLFPARSQATVDTDDYQPVAYDTDSGGHIYMNIQDAVTNTEKYVRLLADSEQTATVPSGKEIIFYSYGHSMGSLTNNGELGIYGSDKPTNNPNVINNGILTLSGNAATVYSITNNGTLKIASGITYDLNNITGDGSVSITGGTFSTQPTAEQLAEWYAAKQQSDNTYKVSKMTLQDAVPAGMVAASGTVTTANYYRSVTEGMNNAEKQNTNLYQNRQEDVVVSTLLDGYNGIRVLNANGYTYTGSITVNDGCGSVRLYGKGTAQEITLNDMRGDLLYVGGNTTAANVTIQDATLNTLNVVGRGDCTINGGQYQNIITNIYYAKKTDSTPKSIPQLSITGGFFASDAVTCEYTNHSLEDGTASKQVPLSDFVADGYIIVESTGAYPYQVVKKSDTAAEVVVAEPNVQAPDLTNPTDEEKAMADAVKDHLSGSKQIVSSDSLSAAAGTVANSNKVTSDEGKAALDKNSVPVAEGATVSIVIQPYLDIAIQDVQKGNGDVYTLSLDITPKYNVIATTDPDNIKLEANGDTNAVVMRTENLVINREVSVSIPLPANFVNKSTTLYVQHKKDTRTYVYEGSIDNNNILTFTNPHGFSEFIITSEGPAAKVGDTSYASLQDAVADANDGATIEILKSDLSATFSDKTLTFKNGTKDEIKVTLNGMEYTITAGATSDAITGASSGGSGGGGGGIATYTNTVSATTNGTVTVSPKSAAKDATVTITVKPSAGYALDTLTVKDADGKTVEVTKKSDTEYTFKMPASKVTISATFAEQAAAEPTNPFTDVAAGAYYYDAVRWAVENEITNGMTPTTFGPNEAVSRAQMVTFLWRAASSPKATGANPFTDVSTSDYYYDAVLWAVSKGITNGMTATTFGPAQPVSRAQAVTFQWRAAGSPAASGESFADVPADAYYADAVLWAVANEITNGMTATSFGPDDTVSRAQAVTFLYRAAN